MDAREFVKSALYEMGNRKRLLRHFSAYKQGEATDPETGLSHLAHAGCNALFLLWFEIEGEGDKVEGP